MSGKTFSVDMHNFHEIDILLFIFSTGNWSALIPIIMTAHEINDAILGAILMSALAGK
jgi:hypothetical protein